MNSNQETSIQKKEPTPSAKCEIKTDEVTNFLHKHYNDTFTDVKDLAGGKHSKAFSYKHDNKSFVIRFNTENRGFLKDKYAFDNFGQKIQIPRIIQIGNYQNIYFCISEKILGETARDQYNREDFHTIPLLYRAIEEIAINEPAGTGYGYLDLEGKAPYKSSQEYIKSVYDTTDLFDWNTIFNIPFVDKEFADYVATKMKSYAQYTTEKRELLHGDFGADNVFIENNAISGIIDWEKMRCGDHFLDVGRVLLFCPDRKATTRTALEFYGNMGIKNWKERVGMGVYHVILTNYAYAALAGNRTSCDTSKTRLGDLERGLYLV